MHPELITLAGRTFYWYGVMMALAFLSGIMLWRHMARRRGLAAEYGSDLAIWVLLPGLAGARLMYVFANMPYFIAAPGEIWRIDHGGLIFYGGIIGGAAGALWFARRRKESPLALFDFLVVAIPLGHFFGRIGCFLNGCCYGLPLPGAGALAAAGDGCGVAMAGDPTRRYPVQLFEAAGNLLIFAALYKIAASQPRRGLVSAAYLFMYPSLRFAVEFFRGDYRMQLLGLTAAQWLSLALVAGAIILTFHAYRTPRNAKDPVRSN